MNEYLLSVVIPTKNRAVYANKCIRQVLECSEDKIQIVVQDNSTDDILEKMIQDLLVHPNVTYQHTKEPLSFVDNFDYALQMAQGRYVTIIGDDDGITSELFKVAEWAEANQLESVKPNLNAIYFWPGSKVFNDEDDTGKLQIDRNTARIRWADPYDGVVYLLKNGCQDYLKCDLVKIYHGVVKKDLLDRVKSKTGKYVAGLSPDIYLSVALSICAEKKMAVIDVPITISGICKGSGSSQSSTGEHTGKLEDAPHFNGHDHYMWKEDVPGFYSVETIWADSALAAVEDISFELRKNYNNSKLVFDTIKKYSSFKNIIWENYINHGGNIIKYSLQLIKEFFKRGDKSIKYRFSKHKKHTYACADIQEASIICEKEIFADYELFEGNARKVFL